MTLRIILVRHGETEWHGENRYAGSSDVALTAEGRAQGEALARWAVGADLDQVWASPLTRSCATARMSSAATGLGLQIDERLRELDFGVAEGLTQTEMRARFPQALAAFLADPVTHHFPRGEPPDAAVARYVDFLDELRARRSPGRVLVVAHSTAIRLTLCHLLGIPITNYRRAFPFLANCALNEIVLDEGGASLLMLNRPVTGDLS